VKKSARILPPIYRPRSRSPKISTYAPPSTVKRYSCCKLWRRRSTVSHISDWRTYQRPIEFSKRTRPSRRSFDALPPRRKARPLAVSFGRSSSVKRPELNISYSQLPLALETQLARFSLPHRIACVRSRRHTIYSPQPSGWGCRRVGPGQPLGVLDGCRSEVARQSIGGHPVTQLSKETGAGELAIAPDWWPPKFVLERLRIYQDSRCFAIRTTVFRWTRLAVSPIKLRCTPVRPPHSPKNTATASDPLV